MTIDEVIAGYLNEKGRMVIVPGFGAFVRREGGGTVFIELLSADDGVLRNEAGRRMGCPPGEAAVAVDKYAELLKKELASGKTVTISGLGSLKTGVNGKYVFMSVESGSQVSSVSTAESERSDFRTKKIPEPAELTNQRDSAPGTNPNSGNVRAARTEAEPLPEAVQYVQTSERPAVSDGGRRDRSASAERAYEEPLRSHENVELTDQNFSAKKRDGEPTRSIDSVGTFSRHSGGIPVREVLREPGNGAGNAPATSDQRQPHIRTAPVKPVPVDYSPSINIRQRNKKKRMDSVMLIAIIAIAVAIVVIAYGRIVEKNYSVDLNDVMIVDGADR